MCRLAPLAAAVALATSLTACAAAQSASRFDRIEGRVVAEVDGDRIPVGEVVVTISPVGEQGDVVGVALTNYTGHFFIDRLSDRVARTERPLLREQAYVVKLVAPEYYIHEATLDYGSGTGGRDFLLERKDSPLDAVSLPQVDPDAGQRVGVRGSVRRK